MSTTLGRVELEEDDDVFIGFNNRTARRYFAHHRNRTWTLYLDASGQWFEACTRCAHAALHGCCTWCAGAGVLRLADSTVGVRRALRERNESPVALRTYEARQRSIERWAQQHAAVACGLAHVRARTPGYENAAGRLVSLALNAARAPLSEDQCVLAWALLEGL